MTVTVTVLRLARTVTVCFDASVTVTDAVTVTDTITITVTDGLEHTVT